MCTYCDMLLVPTLGWQISAFIAFSVSFGSAAAALGEARSWVTERLLVTYDSAHNVLLHRVPDLKHFFASERVARTWFAVFEFAAEPDSARAATLFVLSCTFVRFEDFRRWIRCR